MINVFELIDQDLERLCPFYVMLEPVTREHLIIRRVNVFSGRRSQVVGGGGDAGAGWVARVQRVGRGRVQRALAGGGGAAAARRLPRAAAAAAHARPPRRGARALRSGYALSLATSLFLPLYLTRNITIIFTSVDIIIIIVIKIDSYNMLKVTREVNTERRAGNTRLRKQRTITNTALRSVVVSLDKLFVEYRCCSLFC